VMMLHALWFYCCFIRKCCSLLVSPALSSNMINLFHARTVVIRVEKANNMELDLV
jgi:hypothetical protein